MHGGRKDYCHQIAPFRLKFSWFAFTFSDILQAVIISPPNPVLEQTIDWLGMDLASTEASSPVSPG